MASGTNFEYLNKTGQPDKIDRSVVSAKRSAFLGFVTFFIISFLVGAIIYQRYLEKKRDKEDEAFSIVNSARVRLQESLAYSLSATRIMSFFIGKDGSVTNFDSVASEIMKAGDDLDAVQIAPAGTIRYMYPLKGNETVIGYDILSDPSRNKEALMAIEKRELYFAGPFELRQGGVGVVGRLPVFRNNKFWGFTAVVIKMPTLLKAAGIDSTGNSGYYFQLSKINPDTRKEEFFIKHNQSFSKSRSVSVTVPNGEWQLSVIPVKPFDGFENIIILTILGLLVSLLGGVSIYNVSRRPKRLNDLVWMRTAQLKESEENYKVLFERSPLPLWIYDSETLKFLEVNDAAVNLYGYTREEFLQMNLLAIRPEEDIQDFLKDNENTGDGLREAGVWTHLKKNKQEIQVLIFSRNIFYKGRQGKLILLMDVSEKVKVENELIRSEEKYRSLIEQASDGIILYSFDGRILSFNKAAYAQTGYTEEEFQKLNLRDLFFENGVLKKTPSYNRTNPDQTAILYRQLKRKDGSVFTVELNTKMLPDGKIIAIIRDITEREKTEAALKESEEKFSKAFHSNLLGLALYDADFMIVDTNDAYAAILESPKEEHIGKHSDVAGIISKMSEEKRAVANQEIDEKFKKEGRLNNYEMNIESQKGEQQTILVSMEPLRLNNKQYWLTSAIDITSKKKAELVIFYNESKYRSLIEQASDGIIITDLKGNILEVNQSIARMGDYNINDMPGRHIQEFIPQEDITANPFRFNDVLQGASILHERRFLKKDGTYLEVEVNSKMTNLNTLIGFVRDITERKRNEEKLRYQARLLDVVSDAITSLDTNRCIVSWNHACELLYGFTAEQVIGKRIPELVTFEYPGTTNEEVFKQVFREGEWRGEFIFIHPVTNTKTYLLSSINSLKNTEGIITGFIITSSDITERKMAEDAIMISEEKYRTLVEQASDAIFIAGKDGRFNVVNPSGYKLSQYSPDELMNMTIYDLVSPEDLKRNPFRFSEMENNNVARSERRMIRKDGTCIDVEVTAKFISGDRFLAFIRDVSERKRAEEEIRKSNERFELIAQATNDAVWDHDFVKNETWGNKKLYNLYGVDPEKTTLSFETFLERIHPDERNGIEERMKAAIKRTVNSLSEEFRFKTADGAYRNFYDRAYIMYDENGQPVKMLGAMQDITDREVIKEQILKEKELSDSIVNSLPGIFYLYNKEGRFLRWNKNFETVSGYTAEEIANMHPLDFFDEDEQPLLTEKIGNVFVTGQDYVEANLLLKNKEKILYYFTGQAIEYEGETCLMGVGIDFSEREKARKAILESETKYRELIEQASDGIFISNREGRYIDVNTSACKMLGYTKEELLKMTGADILYNHNDSDGLPDRYTELKTGKSTILETALKKKDGSLLMVESNSKMLSDGRFLGIVRDITERKKAENALRESEERYRALVENATEALVVLDVEKQLYVSVSESASKLFRMPKEELLKLGPLLFSPEYQPDGRLSSESAREKIQLAIDGAKISFEWTYLDKFGAPISCEVWLVRLPSEISVLIRGSIVDISERKKVAEEIKNNSELLRELYSYSQNIREEERTHIAREIHDELGQQLTGLKMDLSWISRKLKTQDEMVTEKLLGTISLIDTTIKTVRKIATELRPSILDDLGLVAALEWHGEEFAKRSHIKVIFTSGLNELPVDPESATALFRIYQELLTNVARHSGATLVETSIYINNDKLCLSVADNGIGFDANDIASKKTLGLRGIKERTSLINGSYEIKSKPGGGTFVLISVPLHNKIT